jgi:predicted metal-binding protein
VTIVGPGGVPRARSVGIMAPMAELWRSFAPRGASRVASTENHLATIYVCVTCRRASEPDGEPRPGALLADATVRAAEGSGVSVRRVRCLANCTRGPSAAVRANRSGDNHNSQSWTYIFGGLELSAAAALIDGARLLAGAADGLMPWRGRPEPLKRGLIARVPPLDFEEETS